MRAGGKRLLGLAMLGPYLPGLQDEKFGTYRSQLGVRFLAAGCLVSREEELLLRQAAYEYSQKCNAVIVAEAFGMSRNPAARMAGSSPCAG